MLHFYPILMSEKGCIRWFMLEFWNTAEQFSRFHYFPNQADRSRFCMTETAACWHWKYGHQVIWLSLKSTWVILGQSKMQCIQTLCRNVLFSVFFRPLDMLAHDGWMMVFGSECIDWSMIKSGSKQRFSQKLTAAKEEPAPVGLVCHINDD